MPAMVNGNEIALVGAVGDPSGWGWDDCFTAADVIMALAQVGDRNDVVIRLNSGGGIATEGSAIHSAIARHKGKKTILVEGIAASAASIIAMAGDEVVMALGAILMIHDPSGLTIGTVADHQAQIAALTSLGDAMSTIYAAKSKQTVEACRADMQAEVWLTADQAVAKGYVDRSEGSANDDVPVDPSPFNYAAYAHPPTALVAMAQAKHWTKPLRMAAPTPMRADRETRMPNMTDDELKVRLDAARAEGKADGEAKVSASTLARSQASEIAKLCNDGGVPAMAAALLAEGATVEQARARVDQAGKITDMVALARKANPQIAETTAAEFIASGKTLDQVREVLFDKLVALGTPVDDKGKEVSIFAHHRAGAGGANREGGESKAASRASMKANMKAQLARNGGSTKAKEA